LDSWWPVVKLCLAPVSMKRFASKCSRLVVVLSMLGSLALTCLWLRSFAVRDYVDVLVSCEQISPAESQLFTLRCRTVRIISVSGSVCGYDYVRDMVALPERARWVASKDVVASATALDEVFSGKARRADQRFRAPGFRALATTNSSGKITSRSFACRFWLLVLIVSLPSVIAFGKRLRGRLRTVDKSLCRKCGYDLRATPSRCPECGEPSDAPPDGEGGRAAGLAAEVNKDALDSQRSTGIRRARRR
jgi:hypothetical protein